MKKAYDVPEGPPQHPFLYPVIRAGDFVSISDNARLLPGKPPTGESSGWLPDRLTEGGIEAETRQTIDNLRFSFEVAGASFGDVGKVNTFLQDVGRDFHAYNKVYQAYFPEAAPTQTTVGAKIYEPILVEIECVAYAPEG